MTRGDKQALAGAAGFQAIATASTVLASPDGFGPEGVKQVALVTAILWLVLAVHQLIRVGRSLVRAVRSQKVATLENTATMRQLISVVSPEPPESGQRIAPF